MVPMGVTLFVLTSIAFFIFKSNSKEQKPNTAFGAGAKGKQKGFDREDVKKFMNKETMDEQARKEKMTPEELKAYNLAH